MKRGAHARKEAESHRASFPQASEEKQRLAERLPFSPVVLNLWATTTSKFLSLKAVMTHNSSNATVMK